MLGCGGGGRRCGERYGEVHRGVGKCGEKYQASVGGVKKC